MPINFRLTAEDFAYIFAHSGARVVCVHSAYLDAVAEGWEPPCEVGSTAANAEADPPVTFHCAVTLGFPGAAITRAQILPEAHGKWDDARILSLGYAYEQRTQERRAPTLAPIGD